MNSPHPFRDERDLPGMLDVLVRGRQANNGSYYIHTGDLKWWLYYPPLEGEYWDHIYLWDDPEQPGRCLGWALISPNWVGFDVYAQPELRGSERARAMYLWAEEQATHIAREIGKPTIYMLWGLHTDDVLARHFRQRGYHLRRGYIHLTRELEGAIPETNVPEGFVLRACRGEAEVTARARSQYGAFGSSAAFADYEQRFRNFMHSPVYDPELDVVCVAQDGRVGAFCIVWIDPINRVGLFEPVGTHPDFQRRGLGRAVMLEGLRRLKERGMQAAIVSSNEDNQAGINLYEAVGFQQANRLGTYEKEV